MDSDALLYGGPHDGAKVRMPGGGLLPVVIFVGPVWLGDGFSAWSAERCERFPVRYEQSIRGVFKFVEVVGGSDVRCPGCYDVLACDDSSAYEMKDLNGVWWHVDCKMVDTLKR